MRHALANLLYRLGARLDRPVRRDEPLYGDFGEVERNVGDGLQASLFMRRHTPIGGHFTNDSYSTHATLLIGGMLFYMERESTLRMIAVLEEMRRRYDRYGERGWHS